MDTVFENNQFNTLDIEPGDTTQGEAFIQGKPVNPQVGTLGVWVNLDGALPLPTTLCVQSSCEGEAGRGI